MVCGISFVYGRDLEFLQNMENVETVGTTQRLGMIDGSFPIGTADNTFYELGRIWCEEGHLPEQSGEIAMEVSLLSKLGYTYRLNQTISLSIQIATEEGNVWIEKEFSL